jgi:Holliday junction resolvasome RuvABC ATP-dependent DNA helicase subunit
MKLDILGQPNVSVSFSERLSSFEKHQQFTAALLVSGPAGVGKSHATKQFCRAMAEIAECEVIEVDSGSQFCRADSKASMAFSQALDDSNLGTRTIIFVDEAQNLPLSGGGSRPSPMARLWQALLYGAGEGWGRVGSVEIEGKQVSFDLRNILVVLATNFPSKIVRGNRNASERRFMNVVLEKYDHTVIKKVIASYFEHKNLRVLADVRAKLERMHRGTLEALDDFAKRIDGYDMPLRMEDFREVLPTCIFTLRGFRHEEVAALRWIATTIEPTLARYVKQKFPALDVAELYRHAQEQMVKAKTGELINVPFLVMHGNRYVVTEAGKAFLKTL